MVAFIEYNTPKKAQSVWSKPVDEPAKAAKLSAQASWGMRTDAPWLQKSDAASSVNRWTSNVSAAQVLAGRVSGNSNAGPSLGASAKCAPRKPKWGDEPVPDDCDGDKDHEMRDFLEYLSDDPAAVFGSASSAQSPQEQFQQKFTSFLAGKPASLPRRQIPQSCLWSSRTRLW